MTCTVEECSKKAHAKGLCPRHYTRLQRNGDPLNPGRIRTHSPCTIKGCDAQMVAKGMCELHYRRWRANGSTEREPSPEFCSIPGCVRATRARGLCELHYNRLRKHGSVDDPTPTLEERFWRKVDRSAGPKACWPWLKAVDTGGYGIIAVNRRSRKAHRVAYQLAVGPVPDGAELDHRCHSDSQCTDGPDCQHRRCCNPTHLEPVSQLENKSRAHQWGRPLKLVCKRGHLYTPDNTAFRKYGSRQCKACVRYRWKVRQASYTLPST